MNLDALNIRGTPQAFIVGDLPIGIASRLQHDLIQ